MKMYFVMLLVLIIPYSSITASSVQTTVSINTSGDSTAILRESTVTTFSKKVFSNVNLCLLNDSIIRVSKKAIIHELLIREIQVIKIHNRGSGTGVLIGGGIGFVIGFIAGGTRLGFEENFNLLKAFGGGIGIGFPFAMLGSVFGSLFGSDKLFDLSNLDHEAKKRKIVSLIRKFPK